MSSPDSVIPDSLPSQGSSPTPPQLSSISRPPSRTPDFSRLINASFPSSAPLTPNIEAFDFGLEGIDWPSSPSLSPLSSFAARADRDIERIEDVEEDEEWSTGDFELISSDGVSFRIERFYLYAASPRLRDESKRLRGSTLTNITLALTDPVLETATVVRRVLRVLTGAKLNLTHDLVSERRVLLLLRKWGCHPILQNLLLRIRHALVREPTKFSPLHVWATGAVLGDVETCVAALEVPTTWPSSSEEGHRADAGTVGVSVFNPLSWPLEWWEMGIPPKYVWALCQAYLKSANGEGRIDIPTLVETFKGTLEESGADASLS